MLGIRFFALTGMEAFHAFILTIFQDRPSLELIERGAYRLVPRSVLEGAHAWNAWETLLYPGAEVLLTAALVISSRNEPLQKVLCPNCGNVIALRGEPREVVQWRVALHIVIFIGRVYRFTLLYHSARFSCGTFFHGTRGLKVYHSSRSLPRGTLMDKDDTVREQSRTRPLLHYSVIPVAFKGAIAIQTRLRCISHITLQSNLPRMYMQGV